MMSAYAQLSQEQRQQLQQSSLFAQLPEDSIKKIISHLSARRIAFARDHFLFRAGDTMLEVGFLLSGSVRVLQEDFWGNRTILEQFGPGQLFGEALACAATPKIPITVQAAQQGEALFLPVHALLTPCEKACPAHQQLIRNLLHTMAAKNILLVQKMNIVTRRSTREKLLSYLSMQALQHGSNDFCIPFNRQELADFLAVDRSAMSAELSRMQKEGLLEFHRNAFLLHHPLES